MPNRRCNNPPVATASSSTFQPRLVKSLRRFRDLSQLEQAVDSLPRLARVGLRPDVGTLASLLCCCLQSGSLALSRRIHLHLKLTGLKKSIPSHTFLANNLLHLHFLCERPDDARSLFDKMAGRNVFSYNAMISGYSKLGMLRPARKIFEKMEERDVVSWNLMIITLARGELHRDAVNFYTRMRRSFNDYNEYTFSSVLIACVRLAQRDLVKQFHCQIMISGLFDNVILTNSLLDAYTKCEDTRSAMKLFEEMKTKSVHSWTILASALAKSGDLLPARKLFAKMPEKNLISWSSFISGCVQSGNGDVALDVFVEMIKEGIVPGQYAISSAICACANIGSLKHVKQFHTYLTKSCLVPNAVVLSSLADAYSKCGNLLNGWRIFSLTPDNTKNTISWNTMLSAFGMHGQGIFVMKLFDWMIRIGVIPDSNTFVVVLTSCNHSCLVREGIHIFESMVQDHDIVPDELHQACFVDLLGRAGLIKELNEWIHRWPHRFSSLVWKAVLGACRIHGNSELAMLAADNLIQLEPQSSSTYVLLGNIYANAGKWEAVQRVRSVMEERKIRKEKAISWIYVKDTLHSFEVSDRSHPLVDEVYAIVDSLHSFEVFDRSQALIDGHVTEKNFQCHAAAY